jgi:hypothetical protein
MNKEEIRKQIIFYEKLIYENRLWKKAIDVIKEKIKELKDKYTQS